MIILPLTMRNVEGKIKINYFQTFIFLILFILPPTHSKADQICMKFDANEVNFILKRGK